MPVSAAQAAYSTAPSRKCTIYIHIHGLALCFPFLFLSFFFF
jgi:hypothetical protein